MKVFSLLFIVAVIVVAVINPEGVLSVDDLLGDNDSNVAYPQGNKVITINPNECPNDNDTMYYNGAISLDIYPFRFKKNPDAWSKRNMRMEVNIGETPGEEHWMPVKDFFWWRYAEDGNRPEMYQENRPRQLRCVQHFMNYATQEGELYIYYLDRTK